MNTAARPRGWRGLHPAARVIIVIVAGVVVLNVALRFLDSSTRGADETAPRSSGQYQSTPSTRAWARRVRAR